MKKIFYQFIRQIYNRFDLIEILSFEGSNRNQNYINNI